jgi:hypothetical protein
MKKFSIKELAFSFEQQKNRLAKQSALQITQTAELCEVIADGCRRVIECHENLVTFEQVHKRVTVTGHGLKLRNWGVDGVTVSGAVESVEFSDTVKTV